MNKELLDTTERASETILADEEQVNKDIQTVKDKLYSSDLVALAAPEMGIDSRFFCIKFNNGDIRTFINPIIVTRTGSHMSIERLGESSEEYIVPRCDSIEATYQTPMGVIETNAFEGLASELFQQMSDLLDGVRISEYGLPIGEEWYQATDEEKEEVLQWYAKSLAEYQTNLKEDIEHDEEAKKLSDAIDFMTSVQLGKTIVEQPEEEIHLNREQRRTIAKMNKAVNKKKR